MTSKRIFGIKFFMRRLHHILKANQFPREILEKIFREAEKIKKGKAPRVLEKKSITLLFWEPSSRTFGSFYEAIGRLGGRVIPIQNAGQFSSVAKGETLRDTIRTFAKYTNGIVMRHFKEGSAEKAARVLDEFEPQIPLINAGDGKGEHPTQMLLDIFTIWEKKKEELKSGKLKVGFIGDLKNSRVFHSNLIALSIYKTNFFLMSEKENDIPEWIKKILKERGSKFEKTSDPRKFAKDIDIWVWTRLQKERLKKGDLENIHKTYDEKFGLTPELKNLMKKNCLVLHPLPRIGEVPEDFDSDPRAIYFKDQIENGLYVRMALLKMIFGVNTQ